MSALEAQEGGIGGVVVLYHPDEHVFSNIKSYLGHLDLLVVVDNSPVSSERVRDFLEHCDNAIYVWDGINHGVAASLNIGAEYAIRHGLGWLLTMDQDSQFEPGSFQQLLKEARGVGEGSKVGILAPEYSLQAKDTRTVGKSTSGLRETYAVLTSGNLLNLAAYRAAGRFLEKLFIDYVDFEYCQRLRGAGYRIMVSPDIFLRHALGAQENRYVLGVTLYPTHHSALRKYYITRNRLYVWRHYPFFAFRDFKSWLKECLLFFLFEHDRVSKLRHMAWGIRDFFRDQYGPFKSESEPR